MRSSSDRLDALRKVPLFDGMSDAELGAFADRAVERTLGPHETVFREGDPASGLFVVMSGVVTIVSDRVGQPIDPLARLEAGGFFGEMGLLDGGERTTTAITSAPTVLLQVRSEDVVELLRERPLLAVKLRTGIIRRHGENVASTLKLAGRSEVRTRVEAPIELRLANGSSFITRLENLSAGGACLRTAPETWDQGVPVRGELRSPGGRLVLAIDGVVSWRNRRGVGIAFRRAMEAEVEAALRRLLGKDPR